MTLDAGHEYTQPCEVLFETKSNYLIKLPDYEKLVWKDSTGHDSVREVKEKVDLPKLINLAKGYAMMDQSDGGIHVCNRMADFLRVHGALKDGMYEI